MAVTHEDIPDRLWNEASSRNKIREADFKFLRELDLKLRPKRASDRPSQQEVEKMLENMNVPKIIEDLLFEVVRLRAICKIAELTKNIRYLHLVKERAQ